jgi:hypothetical protein
VKTKTVAVKVEDDSWFDTSVGASINFDGVLYKIISSKMLEVGNWYSEYELFLARIKAKDGKNELADR